MKHVGRCRSRAIVVGASSLLLGAFVGEAVAQGTRGRVTWQGVRTQTLMGPECQSRTEESFVWVGEVDTNGETRWLSRKIRWTDVKTCAREVLVLEDSDGDPTTPPRRVLRPWSGRCDNRGEVDLATWDGEKVRPRCQESPRLGYMHTTDLPTGWAGPKPDDMMREGCAVNRREVAPPGRSGHIGITTESVIRTDEVNATVQLVVDDLGVANTFPSPGAQALLIGRSTVPVRWKFIIGASSRLRGYATNKDVDVAFFEIFNLPNLRGRYGTLDPDLIFDPSRYEPPWDRTDRWKRPYPGTGRLKWSILESKGEESNVSVDLTTMDFAAHGEVVALVRSPCGGGWVQVNTTDGKSGMSVPLDADRNVIADNFKDYAGLAADSDEDAEPNPSGTTGDGFTAFEEYRGFMRVKPSVTSCNSKVTVEHVRTNPKRKDLFIHATDPLLWRAAMHFGMPSGLAVHMICPQEPIGLPPSVINEAAEAKFAQRVVNKTSGIARALTGHAGERLTLDLSQHWVRVVNENRPGLHGESIRIDPDDPARPVNIDRVTVGLDSIRRAVRAREFVSAPHGGSMFPEEAAQVMFEHMVLLITWHELGHSVGLEHHGNIDPRGSAILLDQPTCLPGMQAGTVDGTPTCVAIGVANRGGRFSGNASCPMRRIQGNYYVPPSSEVLRRVGYRDFRPAGSWSWSRPQQVEGWRGGPVLRYHKRRDQPGFGPFCTSHTGTGINDAREKDLNHSGDATRKPPCAAQLRVNDTR